MKSMILPKITKIDDETDSLELVDIPNPIPKKHEVLIKVVACGVCHTELDEIEGRTPPSRFPMVLGHEVVGRVVEKGKSANKFDQEL